MVGHKDLQIFKRMGSNAYQGNNEQATSIEKDDEASYEEMRVQENREQVNANHNQQYDYVTTEGPHGSLGLYDDVIGHRAHRVKDFWLNDVITKSNITSSLMDIAE